MKLYEFWASNSQQDSDAAFPVKCYGCSNISLNDALRVANERARIVSQLLRDGKSLGDYNAYADRPQREEIIERLESKGEIVAAITRNSYGALVLNSARVLFGDVDLAPEKKPNLFSWFKKKEPLQEPGSDLVERINDIVSGDARLTIRLYRTCAGFRFVVTSRLFDADGQEGIRFLENLNCDPLYIRLCKSQECYRARLTPKCWRMRLPQSGVRFPYENDTEAQRLAQWVEQYNSISQEFSTCAVVGNFGNADTDSEAEKIIQLHDHFALNGDFPLA